MRLAIKLFLILLFGFQFSFAQNNIWSLEKCITYALQNNIQIKQTDLSVKSAQLSYSQAKFEFLPTLNADASHSYNFGKSVDPVTNIYVTNKQIQSNSFSLNSNFTIFNGFEKQNQLAANHLEWEATMNDLQKAKNDISINIATAYLNVLYAKEQINTSEKQLGISQLQKIQTQKLVAVGNVPELNLKDIDAQLANEELNVVTAQNNFDLAKLKLLQFLEMSSSYPIEVDTTLSSNLKFDAVYPSVDNLFETARSQQPVVLAQQFRLKEAEKNLNIRKGAMMPSLSLFGSLNTRYSDAALNYISYNPVVTEKIAFNTQVNDNFGKAVGLSLSIPILNGRQAYTSMAKTSLNVLNAKYNLQLIENQLKQEIAQAHTNLQAAAAKYRATEKFLDATQGAFEANTKKYNAGVINTLEYNTAKNNLAKAQSDFLSAKYDFLFKSKILDFYQGKSLY